MPSKSNKFENLKNSLIVFGLITLLIGCFLCAVLAPFAIELSDKVAYADSSNGIVEDNICKNNDLTQVVGGTGSAYTGFDLVRIATTDTTFQYGVLTNSRSSNCWCSYYLDTTLFTVGNTYTLTFYVRSNSGTFYYGFANYTNGSFSQSSTSSSNTVGVLSKTYTYTTSMSDPVIMFGCSAVSSVSLLWVKVEVGSSFTGYVAKDYENYGYEQGLNTGYQNGYNTALQDYLQYAGLVSNLNVDSYISNGGFEIALTGSDTVSVLQAQQVENHTRSGNEGVSTIYDGLTAGLDYNLIYTQGSFPSLSSSSFSGTAGYYGVKSSLLYANGFNNYIPKGSVFNINLVSGRANYGRFGDLLYRNQSFSFVFLDVYGNPIYYNSSDFNDNEYYFIGSSRIFSDSSLNEYVMGVSDLGNASNVYVRIPYDVYGVLIFSYHNATDYYHAYHVNLTYYPATTYSEGYDAGFAAGQSSFNSQAFYNQGYSQGFSAGEISGAANANNYTFLGVIGAVIDAPIQGLKGLLNFNLLGTNMQGFVLALLTLAVIVFILRLMLGGK